MKAFPPVLALALAACSSTEAPREDAEPLFRALETGTAIEAMEAAVKLRETFDESMVPRLARTLEAAPRAAQRGLGLAGDLADPASARLLLEKLPSFLASPDAETARLAAVAAGLRRLRGATPLLFDYFDKTDQPAALRALGRIWERKLDDPPLARADEIDRLSVLAVTHKLSMSPAATLESCEAMLRVMTAPELADFLKKHGGTPFPSRSLFAEAVRRPGFDSKKSALIGGAFRRP
jgi:hypothetical protein